MALTKVSRHMVNEKTISSKDFGVLGDGVTNDAAAFRALWNYLRDEWYDNSQSYTVYLHGEIVIDDPTEDLAGVAAFIMDFPCTMIGNVGSTISIDNLSSTTMSAFQIGTYASRGVGTRKLSSIKLDCNDSCSGITFADLFQGKGIADDIQVQNCVLALQNGLRVCNVQEFWAHRWTMVNCDTGLKVEGGGSVTRAEGSDGSYTTSGGPAYNNNNQFNGMFVQNPDEYGIWITQAENTSFSGLVQGTWNQWAFYCSGGDDIRMFDMWFETPAAAHQEVQFTSSYDGRIIVENVHLVSTGADFVVNGARSLTILGGTQLGQYDVNDTDCEVIIDHNESSGGTDLGRKVILSGATQIMSNTEETGRGLIPYNKGQYIKQTIPVSTTEYIKRFGNESTSNTSKGGWGVLHVRDSAGNQCVLEFFFTAAGSYPACTVSSTEKVGTMSGAGATFTITRSGSSPNHIVDIQLENTSGANTLSYECWLYLSQF